MTLRVLEDVAIEPSEGFAPWLASSGTSLAVVRSPQLWLIGLDDDGEVAVDRHGYDGPSAVAAAGPDLWLSTSWQLWRLVDGLGAGERTEAGRDRLFLPQAAWTTGDLGVHDLALLPDGTPLLASAACSSLVVPSDRHGFRPWWTPPFVPDVEPEVRCRLSGVALDGGRPAYVTVAAPTGEPRGWQPHRRDGGAVVDVGTGEVVAAGLSLPHAPRLLDGRLYVCDSGRGDVVAVDPRTGAIEVVVRLPAFVRAMTVVGSHLVVAGSSARDDRHWRATDLADRLEAEGRKRPEQGLWVVDPLAGEVVHRLVVDGTGREVTSLATVPGRRPEAIGTDGPRADNVVTW